MTLTSPEPLTAEHETDGFCSGRDTLDAWLERRARKNQISGASRTYVVCEGVRVVAYYALASGAVAVGTAPGRFRRNMPDPIPVVVLGRLAVDERWQGKGLGRALVRDAGLRLALAADLIGIRGLVTRAISEDAKLFCEHIGFEPSPIDRMTLMITLADLRGCL
jgi:GNAT superfamily N-acetyltransferase